MKFKRAQLFSLSIAQVKTRSNTAAYDKNLQVAMPASVQTSDYPIYSCDCPTVLAESIGAFHYKILIFIRNLFTADFVRLLNRFARSSVNQDNEDVKLLRRKDDGEASYIKFGH